MSFQIQFQHCFQRFGTVLKRNTMWSVRFLILHVLGPTPEFCQAIVFSCEAQSYVARPSETREVWQGSAELLRSFMFLWPPRCAVPIPIFCSTYHIQKSLTDLCIARAFRRMALFCLAKVMNRSSEWQKIPISDFTCPVNRSIHDLMTFPFLLRCRSWEILKEE